MKKIFLFVLLILFNNNILSDSISGNKTVVAYVEPNEGNSFFSYGTFGIDIGKKYIAEAYSRETARTLYMFDLNYIPSNAVINSVSLHYSVHDYDNNSNQFKIRQAEYHSIPYDIWQNIGQATVLFSDIWYSTGDLTSEALTNLVNSSKGSYMYLGGMSQSELYTTSWANLELTLNIDYTISITADNNFTDNSGNGTHGSITINGTTHNNIPSSGYTFEKHTGQTLTLQAVSPQTDNQGYQRTWASCELSDWTRSGVHVWYNQTYSFTVTGDDDGKTYKANLAQVQTTTSGQMSSSENWFTNITLSGNVTVPSGVTLTLNPCAVVTLNSNTITSTGGTITVQSGATISDLAAKLKNGSTLKGLYPTIQSAINAASDYYTVEIKDGTYSGNITVNSKNYIKIIGELANHTTIDGTLTFYSSPGVDIDNFFTCSKINMSNCQDADVYVNIFGSGMYSGIQLSNCDNYEVSSYIKNFAIGILSGSSDGYSYSYLEDNDKGIYATNSDVYPFYSAFCVSNNYDLYAVSGSYIYAENCYFYNETPVTYGNVDVVGDIYDCGDLSKRVASNNKNFIADFSKHTNVADEPPALRDYKSLVDKYINLSLRVNKDISEKRLFDKNKFNDEYILLISDYKNYIENYPESEFAGSALRIVTNSYIRLKDYKEIYEYLNKIINGGGPVSLRNAAERWLISYYREQKDFDSAINIADELLKKQIDNILASEVLFTKGEIYLYDLNNPDKAVECFSGVVSNYPNESLVEFANDELKLLGFDTKGNKLTSGSGSGFSTSSYPNPFNPTTIINYTLPDNESVIIKVYDVLGREVKELVNEQKSAGTYSVEFDGSKLSSGVYFYTITAGQFSQTKKMILAK